MIKIRSLPCNLPSGVLVFFSPDCMDRKAPDSVGDLDGIVGMEKVGECLRKGMLGAVDLGGSGTFWLECYEHDGDAESFVCAHQCAVSTGIQVSGGRLVFRDMRSPGIWEEAHWTDASLDRPDGWYHVILATSVPHGGQIGAQQLVNLIFRPVDKFPDAAASGILRLVPTHSAVHARGAGAA